VVWEGDGAQSPSPDPISGKDPTPIVRRCSNSRFESAGAGADYGLNGLESVLPNDDQNPN